MGDPPDGYPGSDPDIRIAAGGESALNYLDISFHPGHIPDFRFREQPGNAQHTGNQTAGGQGLLPILHRQFSKEQHHAQPSGYKQKGFRGKKGLLKKSLSKVASA